MPSKVTVDLGGLESLAVTLRKATVETINSAADSTASIATQLAPYDPNHDTDQHLNQSIKVKKYATIEDMVAVVGVDENSPAAEYASIVETGSVSQEAQPYMTPAFELGKQQLRNDLRDLGLGGGNQNKRIING